MRERCRQYLPIAILAVFALLLALPGPAAADEGVRGRTASATERVNAAGTCRFCELAQKSCETKCFGIEDKSGMGACLTACDNAKAKCSCDDLATVRSEDLAGFDWPGMTKAACHGFVSCQPNYPSCASWSGYADCDTPYCGSAPRCGDCECDEWGHCWCGPGPAWKQKSERFRVCFDQYSNSCTEWQTITTNFCGC